MNSSSSSSISSSSTILYKALTDTAEAVTVAHEARTPQPSETLLSQDDNGFDTILIVATILAGACCLGGLLSVLFHIHKFANCNSIDCDSSSRSSSSRSNSSGSKAAGPLTLTAKILSTMPPGSDGNTKQPPKFALALPKPWAQPTARVAQEPGWMYALLDDSGETDGSPVYCPLTTPLLPGQQQQK